LFYLKKVVQALRNCYYWIRTALEVIQPVHYQLMYFCKRSSFYRTNYFDKALQYKIPSFNTVQTPVNDATSLLDPYEIRNMGPSRTLILINGKRKKLKFLLYTQTSQDVVKQVLFQLYLLMQLKRDTSRWCICSIRFWCNCWGYEYHLKKITNGGSVTLSGLTSEGDGEMLVFP
jgi:iron complex outermembrane receptor protein